MNHANRDILNILRAGDKLPSELPSLPQVLREGQSNNVQVIVVTSPLEHEQQRQLARRRHDLKAALRTLSLLVKALENGYKFDDETAPAKVLAIAKAQALLEREGQILCHIFHAESKISD